MGSIRIGPALAGFPAFPELPFGALADPGSLPPEVLAQIQQTFAALNFQFTPTSFSFELNSAIFGRPGAFDYRFSFTGDFASLAADPSQLFNAFVPATAANFLIRFTSAETVNLLNGELAIAATADDAGPPIPFAVFFSTLLDPRNFTEDLLAAFTGNLAQFDTLDLSAFTGGVVSGRPNGATVSREGTISRPDGSFLPSEWGVVSFNDEIVNLDFDRVTGGAGDDVLSAGDGAIILAGGGGGDLLLGGAAADTLFGEAGDDVLQGGLGDDLLEGGDGGDVLVGDGGNDALLGGAGDDMLVAGPGLDTLTGGAGGDLFLIDRVPGAVTRIADFSLAAGDRLVVDHPSWFFGKGPDGALTLTLSRGAGTHTIIFEGLTDRSQVEPALTQGSGRSAMAGIMIAEGRGTSLTEGAAVSALIGQGGDDRLIGRAGDDRIAAGAGDDHLRGGVGNDLLFGQDGADVLLGEDGDDVLDGGAGDDRLTGGRGSDILTGGYGADVFVFGRDGAAYDRIVDWEPGLDRIDISALLTGQAVTAGNFADYVRVTPLGQTELTGFIEVDRDGAGGKFGFEIIAQIDGAAFAISNGQSASTLGFEDFIIA